MSPSGPPQIGQSTNPNESNKQWEIEQKYRVDHRDRLLDELERVGGRFIRTELHQDTYLRHPSRDFRTTDEALRLRSIDGTSFVTYKGPRLPGPMKMRPEVELPLVAGTEHSWLAIWNSLGFQVAAIVAKSREVYVLEGLGSPTTVTIDLVESLGLFCEIEVLVDRLELRDEAQNRISSLAEQLGLSSVERRSYLGMLLELRGSL
jgi:adenylate cyclase, class 2